MIISAIVAVARNRVIGDQNQIPWYLPSDLKHFKNVTTGHHIIMGRKCFQSIGQPLPNRTNIVITRNPFYIISNVSVCNSIEESLEIAFDNGEDEVFIIGGAQVYETTQDIWDRLYYTHIDADISGDVFFPKINWENWKEVDKKEGKIDPKNKLKHTFLTYHRC